jgi:O-antigen/teichoic acid export membrane protein
MYAIVFYASMCVAVLFNIFAELVVWILYGKAYLPAAMPLRIVSWYTAFSYLGVARNAWIVSKNRQKHLFKLYAMAAMGNVLLNYFLIPVWGANGAALASLIAQILTGFVLPFFVKDLRENAILVLEGILLKNVIPKKNK